MPLFDYFNNFFENPYPESETFDFIPMIQY